MKDEKLEKDLKTKEVYHFVDTEAGIDQISREVFKKRIWWSTIHEVSREAKNIKQ